MTGLDSAGLMRQAWMTADEYLGHAIECIDQRLGNGYAKSHPELIAAFMQTSARDYAAGLLDNSVEALCRQMEESANSIAGEILKSQQNQ